MMANPIDPITFEVLRNTFEHVCRRMTVILQKSSFSPILSENLDFSNAIYDPTLRLVGQTANCPVHLAAMHFSVQAVARKFGIETLRPGDVVILNDPYDGGTHINDVTLTMPVFYENELIGFAVSRGHWMDLGGGGPGGQGFGTHVAGEGLRLPPLKLYRDYKVDQDLLEILLRNTRTPHYVKGDLQAHMGALLAAEDELRATARKYGRATLIQGMGDMIGYTERIVRAEIEKIPDGVYEGADYADSDGITDQKVWVRVKLTVSGSNLHVDFAGSDPQVAGAINSPFANTTAAVYTALQFFLAPDAPPNAGMFAPISLSLPDDCWLNARWPAPVVGCTTVTSGKVQSAIWQAVAKAIPSLAIAPTCADANWFVAAVRGPGNRIDVFSDIPAGGWGGTPYNDGLNVTLDPLGNCTNMPAEAAELLYPVRVEAFDLRQDSGGPGENRGGLGARFKFRFLNGGELSIETSRTIEGSPGVNGGGISPVQLLVQEYQDGRREIIGGPRPDGTWRSPLLSSHKFGPGEAFEFLSTGGGGWGVAQSRDPERVRQDVIDGYVSLQAARRDYGVALDPNTFELLHDQTSKLRNLA
ncbi:N-methylhydantoinase (plasmid) [Mesorhizobium loti]|uniref:N-methylhydantoinase n=2 Tax=Mesorhizobium TaxID=68287 RepID=Q982K0_RHILO|nr:hydantoinase B/oxoprolinase family protein [Mesorhizobium japonicum]BAB54456.1 N-methylhydantoinase [Mesorhizobium japonicum MAFF 303099]BAV52475.1 N-methylhydantoinase [Mesorhizobium loti]BCH04868.1 N-methylhydantoinase [Mesorhizobium sp. 131-2-5]